MRDSFTDFVKDKLVEKDLMQRSRVKEEKEQHEGLTLEQKNARYVACIPPVFSVSWLSGEIGKVII